MIRYLTVLLLTIHAAMLAATVSDTFTAAQSDLYAGHTERAIQLYREVLKADPRCAAAYDGLVRALLEAHHADEAYGVADAAIENVPGTAAGLAAKARALFRKGEPIKAEKAWRDALALDPKNASAVEGLARVHAIVGQFKTAKHFVGMAYRLAPDDPKVAAWFASSMPGAERLAQLRTALAGDGADSKEAKALRDQIALAEVVEDVKFRSLKSAYQLYELKMLELRNGPLHSYGFGLRVSFNGQRPVTLLLDTGASGISLAPRLAEKFGLRKLSDAAFEVGGIGSGEARNSCEFIAESSRIGDFELANYPVTVFDTARNSDFEGIIGADVFSQFLVTLDFRSWTVTLTPFAKQPSVSSTEPDDAWPRPQGLFPIYRRGHALLVPTFVNGDPAAHLFLIDTGSSSNMIDSSIAHNSTKTNVDRFAGIVGVQGKVKEVSRVNEGTLLFAGFRQRNPDLIAIDLTKISDGLGMAVGGVLGMDVFINLKLTIDYHDASVRFEYQAPVTGNKRYGSG